MSYIEPIRQSQPSNFDPKFLFETLVCNLLQTATSIGLTIQHMRRLPGDRSVRHLLHEDSQIMLFALRYRADMELAESLETKLANLYIQLATAKALLRETVLLRERPSETLRSQWTNLLNLAMDVLREIPPVSGQRLDPRYGTDARAIVDYLSATARGSSPEMPHLQQRRKAPRLSTSIKCIVFATGGERHQGTVLDVSTTGLSLRTTAKCKKSDVIDLEVRSVRYQAQVVSYHSDRVGMRFIRPLSLNDPLLVAHGSP